MIVSINGWPGVGKLTVALELSDRLNARLLDNHTLFNVAIALTEYGSPAYYDAARAVRDVAFEKILALPASVPIILTNVVASGGPSGFAEEHWQSICDLASKRKCPLLSVTIHCDLAEHTRRIVSPERRGRKKADDPSVLEGLFSRRCLFDVNADYRFAIDNTNITPERCASAIAAWIEVALTAT